MEVIYSSRFAREYKRLPDNIKDMAEQQEKIFRQNPFDSKLKTHKLKGKLSGFLSASAANPARRRGDEGGTDNRRDMNFCMYASADFARAVRRITRRSLGEGGYGKIPRALARGASSFSIGYKYRIIFEFSKDKDAVFFHSVGDHDIYQ